MTRIWHILRCRLTAYHHWIDRRCSVCGIGVYGEPTPASPAGTSPERSQGTCRNDTPGGS